MRRVAAFWTKLNAVTPEEKGAERKTPAAG